jgi:hypothetical protein
MGPDRDSTVWTLENAHCEPVGWTYTRGLLQNRQRRQRRFPKAGIIPLDHQAVCSPLQKIDGRRGSWNEYNQRDDWWTENDAWTHIIGTSAGLNSSRTCVSPVLKVSDHSIGWVWNEGYVGLAHKRRTRTDFGKFRSCLARTTIS